MELERRIRLPDGSLGPMLTIDGTTKVDPNLLIAFEAIAMQNELLLSQSQQLEALKDEIDALKGGASS